jgi:hypothetical protein
MRALSAVVLSFIFAASSFAHGNYTGYSSAPGCRGTCASSCHGATGGTVQVSGFPASYTPGQQYTITLRKLSGSTISNFNSSIRIGTGSQNAGTIAAGQFTSVYNATGETNGVHMTSTNHDSATFRWTAPAAGTGNVKLYVAAHQGTYSGPNTTLNMTATEAAVSLPGLASAPVPQHQSQNIPLATSLSWTAGSGATSHDIYFGTTATPDSIRNQTTATYTPSALVPGTTYYWRIDERNAAGVTTGTLWQFRTETPNGVGDPGIALPTSLALGPVYPNPFNAVVTIPFVLPQSAAVDLSLFDINGRLVAHLVNSMLAPGDHQVQWSSEGVGSGVYLLRLTAAGKTITAKIVALK